MPLSSLSPFGPPKPRGCGFGSVHHLPPSQPSANILLAVLPIVVQARCEVHDTLISDPPRARSSDHRVPFQRSTSGLTGRFGFRETDSPTAVQASGEVHDTLLRRLLTP